MHTETDLNNQRSLMKLGTDVGLQTFVLLKFGTIWYVAFSFPNLRSFTLAILVKSCEI